MINISEMVRQEISEGSLLYYKDTIKMSGETFKSGDIKLVSYECEEFIEEDYFIDENLIKEKEFLIKNINFKIHTDKKIRYGHLAVELTRHNNEVMLMDFYIKRFYCWEYI